MAPSSSASASGAATANVRMIRMFTPPDVNETRIFDLTAGDDDEFMQIIMEVDESQINMVEADEEQFHECMEPVVEDVGAASIVALDLQDGESDTVEEPEAEMSGELIALEENQMRLEAEFPGYVFEGEEARGVNEATEVNESAVRSQDVS